MTSRFLAPTQVKLAIACRFSGFSSARKLYRETAQLPSFPTFVRANGVTFFKFFFQTIPDKRVETRSSPLPPLSMLIIKWSFPFLLEKTRYFPILIREDGGYVIQLKCPNFFWPGLYLNGTNYWSVAPTYSKRHCCLCTVKVKRLTKA